jgi:hypothetical protein
MPCLSTTKAYIAANSHKNLSDISLRYQEDNILPDTTSNAHVPLEQFLCAQMALKHLSLTFVTFSNSLLSALAQNANGNNLTHLRLVERLLSISPELSRQFILRNSSKLEDLHCCPGAVLQSFTAFRQLCQSTGL